MADIAQEANVSKMTVSRVLNNKPGVAEETRQRILSVVNELGYSLQSPFPISRPYIVAVLIPKHTTVYLGELLGGISAAAEQLGSGLMLYTQNMFSQEARKDNTLSPLRSGLVNGAIVIVPPNFDEVVASLNDCGIPFVVIDHHSEAPNEASVTATNRKGMLEATRYLLALGHRRIGFVKGRLDITCSHERLQGYMEGLEEIGLPYDPELVVEGNYMKASGFQGAQKLLELPNPPSALIMSNDMMAFGAIEAARVMGLSVGQDVSIIGFDDVYMAAETYPPLTTVRQPLMDMGEVALDMLLDLIENRRVLNLRRQLPTELIVRETTGPAPR